MKRIIISLLLILGCLKGYSQLAYPYAVTSDSAIFEYPIIVGDTTDTIYNKCALIEGRSTTQGLLFPRMTKSQMRLINTPINGVTVYATDTIIGLDTGALCWYIGFYNLGGHWKCGGANGATGSTGATGAVGSTGATGATGTNKTNWSWMYITRNF